MNKPVMVQRMDGGTAQVQVGSTIKTWSVGMMRLNRYGREKKCALCKSKLTLGSRGWREVCQSSRVDTERVCTTCWPEHYMVDSKAD